MTQPAPQVPRGFKNNPYEYHHILEIEIESISNQGMGVARDNEWVIFVPFCLIGEIVRAKIYRNDKNCSYADLVKIIKPSPKRIEPKCAIFGECGGCQYQSLSYPDQLELKQEQLSDTLRRIGHCHVPLNPSIASPKLWNYRSKITPHFNVSKKDKNLSDLGPMGFNQQNSRHNIIDMRDCVIASEAINQAWPAIKADYHKRAKEFKKGSTILLRDSQGTVITHGRQAVTEHVLGYTFNFLAQDFFQNNPSILDDFVGYVSKKAKETQLPYLIDAYCGSGLFGICLSPHFKQVHGIEVSASSADWARHNARLNDVENYQVMAASAEELFKDLTITGEQSCVIIDPPRKGCSPEFLEQLMAFKPQSVIYISCNPSTQARDLNTFWEHGYQATEAQGVDLFPHTKHLESVVVLSLS
mgnify:CR=1 FL=1